MLLLSLGSQLWLLMLLVVDLNYVMGSWRLNQSGSSLLLQKQKVDLM
jgi:hypothetical protein